MPDESPPPLAPNSHYQVRDWCGHDLYVCDDCPFDTLDEGVMRQHQPFAHHRQAEPVSQEKGSDE